MKSEGPIIQKAKYADPAYQQSVDLIHGPLHVLGGGKYFPIIHTSDVRIRIHIQGFLSWIRIRIQT